jgi:thiol-disulfide isomerase/thioredoxin
MKRLNLPLPVLLIMLLIAGLSLYWYPSKQIKSSDVAPASSMAAYIKHNVAKDIPAFAFVDGAGVAKDLSQWKGKVVLLNLWATWCAPCRKEMPDLAKLQKLLGGVDFEVVALSEDLKGAEASAAFLKEAGADNLALYVDQKATALAAVQSPGLPTTLLIGRDGKEVGRLLGPEDWASDAAQALVKAEIARSH